MEVRGKEVQENKGIEKGKEGYGLNWKKRKRERIGKRKRGERRERKRGKWGKESKRKGGKKTKTGRGENQGKTKM